MSAPAAPAPGSVRAATPLGAGALRDAAVAGPVRLLTFGLLLAYGVLHWEDQVRPHARLPAIATIVLALAVGEALLQLRARGVRGRAAWALAVPLAPLVLLVAGLPARVLVPTGWDELANGIGQGLGALPNITVPYRGLDEWVRAVVVAGGVLLGVLGAALAFNGRRDGRGHPVAAAAALSVLWVVPVVQRNPGHPYLDGAGFALLLGAFLWADRLRSEHVRLAAILLGAAVLAALVAAPRLDRTDPWIDYAALAARLSPPPPSTFSWDHTYDPLDWPREGTEILRVRARRPAYWKATVLEDFDGIRWYRSGDGSTGGPDTELARRPAWREELRVVVKRLTSPELIAAGTTLDVRQWDRPLLPGPGGTRRTATRPLRPGDSYVAEVYSPLPTRSELLAAGDAYPAYTDQDRRIVLPLGVPGSVYRDERTQRSIVAQSVSVQFPAWSDDPDEVLVEAQSGVSFTTAPDVVQSSPYGRTYALARRLRAQATGPYDYVRRVLDRVRDGASYTESPPQELLPLDAFLFDTKLGYCQQFSGAMALLLRMGGVPARVASGFSPGLRDAARGEWVVKDTDAHSWVEVYFPRIGWVTFDPTPAEAPPASQSDGQVQDDTPARRDAGGEVRAGGERVDDPESGAAAGGGGGGGEGNEALVVLGVLLLAGCGAVLAAALRRRRRASGDTEDDAELAELKRALRRSGRRLTPPTTLQDLERRLAGEPGAVGYVRALRLRRFGAGGAEATPAGRRALRRQLAAGLGPVGRVRAWWALPPRRPTRQDLGRWLGRRRGRAYTG